MCAIAYGPDPGKREQLLGDLVVGVGRVVQRLEVEPALRDLGGDRLQIWARGSRPWRRRGRRCSSASASAAGARERSPLRRRRSRGMPSSRTIALTIRTVADHVQFVVQIVLTRSSNTVGLRSIRPAPAATQASVGLERGGERRTHSGPRRGGACGGPGPRARPRAGRRSAARRLEPSRPGSAPERAARPTHARPTRRTASNADPSGAIVFGGRSATPCDRTVRAKSTGSPPGATERDRR